MSRFNTASSGTKTVNLAGGQAYKQNPELELVSILLTSFANDQYYRSANDTFEKIKELIKVCDPEFTAKAAVYARKEFGMRSITHIVASELSKYLSGKSWAKDFYDAVIHRPDDMMEILAYHKKAGFKISNAVKKGFALAFDKFDKYQLSKYRGEGKGIKLIDVVNLVHPVPIAKNAEALRLLVSGELRSTDTWEAELTKAGQRASSEEEKSELKKEVWVKLVKEKKIGYFALLRNLRNIIEQAPEILDEGLAMLTDEKLIKKSLVLPFRFITAYDEVVKTDLGKITRKVLLALNEAIDISVSNIPKFDGDTLVVLDVSGSMSGKPAQIGSLFAAALTKSNNADLIVFSNDSEYVNVNTSDSTITIANSIRFANGGTNFHSIFHTAKHKYDRIIILSDMQGWIGHNSPSKAYSDWKRRVSADPFVYSFDLNSYGSLQFPERNVYCLAGFSEKVFDIMKLLEQDKNALVNTIKKIQF